MKRRWENSANTFALCKPISRAKIKLGNPSFIHCDLIVLALA
ncbi:hypothetical protein VC116063_002955 [Vibrio cholerae O1 str. 116063]|nr:hypothetical protein VC116063_002955 [Vibrio cholerae O1 str. 116063]